MLNADAVSLTLGSTGNFGQGRLAVHPTFQWRSPSSSMLTLTPFALAYSSLVFPAPAHPLNIGGMPTQIDALLLEKQQAFDRSKISERIVHPCGSSAFGSFQVTKDISHLTKADFLQPGKKTPTYTRFSTVTYGVSGGRSCRPARCVFETGSLTCCVPRSLIPLLSLGRPCALSIPSNSRSPAHQCNLWNRYAHALATLARCIQREFPDEGRNPRGFATKFYTGDGNYDLVGLSWPVFFVRDPMMGPDNSQFFPLLHCIRAVRLFRFVRCTQTVRSQQRHPKSFLLDFNAWFDYLANVPESQHAGLMLFSDYGTPKGVSQCLSALFYRME